MNKFITFKNIICDFNEFKKNLRIVKSMYVIKEIVKKPYYLEPGYAYIKIGRTIVNLWCKIKGTHINYRFRLDGEDLNEINGMASYRILKSYWKELPDLSLDPFYGYTTWIDENTGEEHYSWRNEISKCSGIIGFNKLHVNTRHENCIGYDINSSFNYAMLKPMPDTTNHPRMEDYVKRNEIGFIYDKNGDFTCVFEGKYAIFIFPLIDSPFKKFVETWYNKKKIAKNKKDKAYAKSVLVSSVGYLQRKNPFLRATIIYYSNINILKYRDKNTLYYNTDSIVSLVKRPDIEENLGDEIGQWKIEHTGSFAYTGFNYQWNKDKPSVRGISKEWYKKDFDVLKDPIPSQGNIYEIDDKYNVRKVKYG